MTIRARLLLLSVLVAVSIVAITALFSAAITSIEKIDRERSELVLLADSIRDLSVAVNSLDSNQYGSVTKKFATARENTELAFEAVGKVTGLPSMNEDLKNAFEIIGNMHALLTDDLKTLGEQFLAFQPELEKYFLESRSTSVRLFYTNERARSQNDLTAIYDKLEELVTSINGMTETLAGVSDTIRAQSDVIDAEAAKIRSQSLVSSITVAGLILIVIVGLVLAMGNSISRRVKSMQTGLGPVSQGDFSHYLKVKGTDEVAGMTKTVNALLDSLNRLLREVQKQVDLLDAMGVDLTSKMRESTLAVDHIQTHMKNSQGEMNAQTEAVAGTLSSARQLGEVTENLSRAFAQQIDILGTSSAGIEQIIANIRSVNANTSRAEASSSLLSTVAHEGQIKVNLVSRSVEEISRSSENLVQVTAIINDIADKTNLLAMNASIEAAHAGNAGRGFGVVAQEIRKLAEQASSQSHQISEDLGIVNENIESIREATKAAVEVFLKITAQTELVGTIIQEVQTSMDEQDRGGALVLEGIRQLNEINHQVGEAIGAMKQGEAEILDRVQALDDQTARVNQNNEAVNLRTREIGSIIAETNALADSTGHQIETLKAETGQFTTLAD